MESKEIGFVYLKTEYKDQDGIVNILTNQNQSISFKVRGLLKANSKNVAACNHFVISEFVFTYKTMFSNKTLKSSQIIKQYYKPYSDLLVSGVFFMIYELIGQIHEQMDAYDLAIQCFDLLENQQEPINVLDYFLKQVTNQLGYAPSLQGCSNCQSKKNLVSFSFPSGGFICKNCFNELVHATYSNAFLKELYNFLKTEKRIELEKNHAVLLLDMYITFLKDEGGLHFNSYDFLKKVM